MAAKTSKYFLIRFENMFMSFLVAALVKYCRYKISEVWTHLIQCVHFTISIISILWATRVYAWLWEWYLYLWDCEIYLFFMCSLYSVLPVIPWLGSMSDTVQVPWWAGRRWREKLWIYSCWRQLSSLLWCLLCNDIAI